MRIIDLHFRHNTIFARNVTKDFAWLQSLSDADGLPDPAAGLSLWFECIAVDDLASPSRFKHLISVAARRQLVILQDDRAFKVWRRTLTKLYEETRLPFPSFLEKPKPLKQFICLATNLEDPHSLCGHTADTHSEWWNHRRLHYLPTLPQRYCLNSVCPTCCKDFRSMAKLWSHMGSGKPQCLSTILTYREELTPEERDSAMQRHNEEKSREMFVPKLNRPRPPKPSRLAGPKMPLVSKEVALQFMNDSIPTVEPDTTLPEPIPLRSLDHKCYFVLHFFNGQR